jgi:hypothetical protein
LAVGHPSSLDFVSFPDVHVPNCVDRKALHLSSSLDR